MQLKLCLDECNRVGLDLDKTDINCQAGELINKNLKFLLKSLSRHKHVDGTTENADDHVQSELLLGFTNDYLVKKRAFELSMKSVRSVLKEARREDSRQMLPEKGECELCGYDEKEHHFICEHPLMSELLQSAREGKRTPVIQQVMSACNAQTLVEVDSSEKKTQAAKLVVNKASQKAIATAKKTRTSNRRRAVDMKDETV